MIEVKNLVKRLDGFAALDGLTMTVPDGAVYGLVGPNGSGKSTLLRHITGIYRQDSGEVLINGEPVFENTAVKAKTAYIPDDIFYFLQATVRDMAAYYRGIYPGFSMERYKKLGEVFELSETLPIRRMSKGMQKQAAFWLCMSMTPELLVLDEPVDGLDPVMRRQIWSIILADAAEHGTTVLVSSHNLRELEDVCDHVAGNGDDIWLCRGYGLDEARVVFSEDCAVQVAELDYTEAVKALRQTRARSGVFVRDKAQIAVRRQRGEYEQQRDERFYNRVSRFCLHESPSGAGNSAMADILPPNCFIIAYSPRRIQPAFSPRRIQPAF